MAGDFISGSEAIGILMITYSLNNESNIHYTFSSRNTDTSLKGLPVDQYNVSVFVVEESGLPFNRSVTRPRNVSVLEGETGRSA